MNTVAEIIEAARKRILAHRIQCSVDLLEYLIFRSSVEDVTLEVLQEEAVRRGLYRLSRRAVCVGPAIGNLAGHKINTTGIDLLGSRTRRFHSKHG